MKIKQEASERHVLTVTVDNEAGILAKIAGLFTARGYNIDSLTVADITENHSVSRITIVTHGPPAQIDQIHAQLERLVPVHKVVDLTEVGPYVERELALIKVAGVGDSRVEALRVADRTARQDRQLRPADARTGAGRSRPHRRGRHDPRAGSRLRILRAATTAPQ
jgi:acetolactate synthase I/III small subunit